MITVVLVHRSLCVLVLLFVCMHIYVSTLNSIAISTLLLYFIENYSPWLNDFSLFLSERLLLNQCLTVISLKFSNIASSNFSLLSK